MTTPRSKVKVEVKSSAYLQSWNQTPVSKIVFSGLTGRSWSDETGRSDEREFRADVYVFAIQTCQEPDQYDALDLSHWEFRVVGKNALHERGLRSITKGQLERLSPSRSRAGGRDSQPQSSEYKED